MGNLYTRYDDTTTSFVAHLIIQTGLHYDTIVYIRSVLAGYVMQL